MVDEAEARIIAFDEFRGMEPGPVRELAEGWYFGIPRMPPGQLLVGVGGVIVNKQTGFPYRLGSAIPPETVLRLYDLGFQASCYDLTVTRVEDRAETIRLLASCRLHVIEESFEHGTHWKIPRAMRDDEIAARLAKLPCTFDSVTTYFCAERLHAARFKGLLAFTLSNPRKSR